MLPHINLFLTRSADSALIRAQEIRGSPVLSQFMNDLFDDTTGATAIEYGLIVALIVVAMIATLQAVADTTIEMWGTVESKSIDAMSK